MVFPEGTTSDGEGVLPFRSSLLRAVFAGNGAAQPLAVRYFEGTQPINPSVRYLSDDSLVQSIWLVVPRSRRGGQSDGAAAARREQR